MKVYVETLPKGCLTCPYIVDKGDYDLCAIKDCIIDDTFKYVDKRKKSCPLLSLADYTKQVRKEVLSELMSMLGDRAELIDCGGVAEFMFTTYDLSMCVEEILGEEEKQNEK